MNNINEKILIGETKPLIIEAYLGLSTPRK